MNKRLSKHIIRVGFGIAFSSLAIPLIVDVTNTSYAEEQDHIANLNRSNESSSQSSEITEENQTSSRTTFLTEYSLSPSSTNSSALATSQSIEGTNSSSESIMPNNEKITKEASIWGTAPVHYDQTTGILIIESGTIGQATDSIGEIDKSKVKKIIFNGDVKTPTYCGYLFSQIAFPSLSSIEGSLDTSMATDMNSMFKDSSVETVDVSTWNTSSVTNMNWMFYNSKVTELDVANWDTSNVISMKNMFENSKVSTLNTSNWNTSKINDMSFMFRKSQLTTLDVSNWDTTNVTNMNHMFFQTKMNNLDVSNWNTSNVTDMAQMFSESNVLALDVSNWNTSNVNTMLGMFSISKVTSLNVSNWDVSNVEYMSYMFLNTSIRELDLSNWDTSNKPSMLEMFTSATDLSILSLGSNSIFDETVQLPEIDTTTGQYTGRWERVKTKNSTSAYNSSLEFMINYNGSFPGTYIWQKTEPSTTEPSTTEPSTTEPSTTESSTTEPSTTESSTTEPSTTERKMSIQVSDKTMYVGDKLTEDDILGWPIFKNAEGLDVGYVLLFFATPT